MPTSSPVVIRFVAALTLCASLSIASGTPVTAQAAPATVTLSRMECGTNAPPTDVGLRFSDTYDFKGFMVQLVYSCYLIRHGDDVMIWDTGFPLGNTSTAPKTSLVQLLAQLSITPAQVRYVGISHLHGDHIGQASLFPQSTLLVGKGDWDVLSDARLTPNQAPVAPWVNGGAKLEPLTGDRDVFGDGSVVILAMPGHTPGHRSLLVRLPEMGPVLLTGDLAHFRENYATNGVPTFNTDRAATLASIDRFKQIAKHLKATVIIQHDARDVAKLPVFPAAAR